MFWNLQTNMSTLWLVDSQMNLARSIWMGEAISYDPDGICNEMEFPCLYDKSKEE